MFSIANILSISVTLFVVIDILGSVPIILGIRRTNGNFNPLAIVIFSGALMTLFSFFGQQLLSMLGIQMQSFSIAGAVVLLLLALEMILGTNIFKTDDDGVKSGNIVPIAFPVLAGVGTLTTILSLRIRYPVPDLLTGILINLLIIFLVLKSMNWLEKKMGAQTLLVMKKFFGIILLAMAVQMFISNV